MKLKTAYFVTVLSGWGRGVKIFLPPKGGWQRMQRSLIKWSNAASSPFPLKAWGSLQAQRKQCWGERSGAFQITNNRVEQLLNIRQWPIVQIQSTWRWGETFRQLQKAFLVRSWCQNNKTGKTLSGWNRKRIPTPETASHFVGGFSSRKQKECWGVHFFSHSKLFYWPLDTPEQKNKKKKSSLTWTTLTKPWWNPAQSHPRAERGIFLWGSWFSLTGVMKPGAEQRVGPIKAEGNKGGRSGERGKSWWQPQTNNTWLVNLQGPRLRHARFDGLLSNSCRWWELSPCRLCKALLPRDGFFSTSPSTTKNSTSYAPHLQRASP